MLTGADIFARVAGTPGAASVKALAADRLYPDLIRSADVAYPYLIYKRDGTATVQAYGGQAGLASLTLSVAAVGRTQASAEAVANALIAELDTTAGVWGSTNVQGCFLDDDGVSDDVVSEPDTEAVIAFVKEVKFTVWFETQPVAAQANP